MVERAEKASDKSLTSVTTDHSKSYREEDSIMRYIECLRKESDDAEFLKICDVFEVFQKTHQHKGLGGHLTASAIILDRSRQSMILTLHAKLGRWLQLGGHLEPGETLWEAAHREGLEESGLKSLSRCGCLPFDIDFHYIPARKAEGEHYHFDVTFVFFADDVNLEISQESLDLRWFSLEDVMTVSDESNLHRIVRRLKKLEGLDNEELALRLS